MPVTNYLTVNGEIIGETTGGVRTDYLTDALGSVTATIDQSASVVNTYRYKPYGELLAKTGAGSDPVFGWLGSQGYVQTGRKYAEQYVRARHYSSTNGRWTSKDPSGQNGGEKVNIYCAIDSLPLRRISGLISPVGGLARNPMEKIKILKHYAEWNRQCGGVSIEVDLQIKGNQKRSGWIIQHMNWKVSSSNCSKPPETQPANNFTGEYWEAWRVENGKIIGGCPTPNHSESPHDLFRTIPESPNRRTHHLTRNAGSGPGINLKGHAQFWQNYDLPKEKIWGCVRNHPAGHLYVSNRQPPQWSDRKSTTRNLDVNWCCCGGRDTRNSFEYRDAYQIIRSDGGGILYPSS